MPLRSSRFYLFGYLHYYEHIRLPRQQLDLFRPVRVSRVHALPSLCTQPYFTPESLKCACCRFFHFSDRFRHLRQIDRSHCRVSRLTRQLTQVSALNSMQFVSLLHLRVTSTRTTNLIAWFFHPCRYLIYIYARFVAYQSHKYKYELRITKEELNFRI